MKIKTILTLALSLSALATVAQTQQLTFKEDAGRNNVFLLALPLNSYPTVAVVDTEGKATQSSIATLKMLGTMRGLSIAQVDIKPLGNEETGNFVDADNNINIVVEYHAPTSDITVPAHLRSPYFDVMRHYASGKKPSREPVTDYPACDQLSQYPVRMLIVTDRMFEHTLQPFVEWKTQKGFDVDVAYTDVIGFTSQEIKNYVHNCYHYAESEGKAAPTFLVIVGDTKQVPTANTYEYTSGEFYESDYDYANTERINKDYFPEMFYGRMSAETTEQLEAIIHKIIYYEKYEFSDPSYLSRANLIAGAGITLHETYVEPKIKYDVANWFNEAHGYTEVYEYGVDDPNNPMSTEYYGGCYNSEHIGVGIMIYDAHADQYRWGDPLFQRATLYATDNENRYPLVIANACLSGDFAFAKSPCIGEEWLRKPKGGAVSYIGASPTTSWYGNAAWCVGKPLVYADGLTFENTTHGADDAPFICDYVSTGGIVFAGNMAATISTVPGDIDKFWTGINVLGDPSLVPFLGEAKEMSVAFENILPVGATSMEVDAPERAMVALSHKNKLLCSALVGPEETVSLSFDAVEEGDTLSLVITKPQHKPVINSIVVGNLTAVETIIRHPLPSSVSIYNMQGILLARGTAAEASTYNLAPGTYIIVKTTKQGNEIQKLLVK